MALATCGSWSPALLGSPAPPGRRVVVEGHRGKRRPFDRLTFRERHGLNGRRGQANLPTPIDQPFNKLPPEGSLLSPDQEFCDPYHHNCQELMYVWEAKCSHCSGTGQAVSSYGSRSRAMFTCLVCHGLGYVRKTSAREPEHVQEALGRTISRPVPTIDGNRAAQLREQAERGRRLVRTLEERAEQQARIAAEAKRAGARGDGGAAEAPRGGGDGPGDGAQSAGPSGGGGSYGANGARRAGGADTTVKGGTTTHPGGAAGTQRPSAPRGGGRMRDGLPDMQPAAPST